MQKVKDWPKRNMLPLELQHHKFSELFNQIRNQVIEECEAARPSLDEIIACLPKNKTNCQECSDGYGQAIKDCIAALKEKLK